MSGSPFATFQEGLLLCGDPKKNDALAGWCVVGTHSANIGQVRLSSHTGGDIWNIASKHMDIMSTATWVFGNSCAFKPICRPRKLLPDLIHAFSLLWKINIWRWLHGQIPSLTEVTAIPFRITRVIFQDPQQDIIFAHVVKPRFLDANTVSKRHHDSSGWWKPVCWAWVWISRGRNLEQTNFESCRCNIQSGLEKQHITTWNFWSKL